MSESVPPENRPEVSPLPSYEIEREPGLVVRLTRSWKFWLAIVILAILALGAVFGPGIYRNAKAERALRLMDEGDVAIAAGKMRDAAAKYRQAQMLAPGDERVQQRSILAAAATGESNAFAQLEKKWTAGNANPEEILIVAEQLRTRNRLEDSNAALASLPDNLTPKLEGRRSILTLLAALDRDGADHAIARAGELSAKLPGSEGDDLRLIQAELLLRKSPPDEAAANVILEAIGRREDATGLRALRLLGTYRVAQPQASGLPTTDLITKLRTHPASAPQDEMLALQVDDRSRPGETASILEDLVHRKGSAPLAERTALAQWLSVQQQYTTALSLLPAEEAKGDQDALLTRLEALSGLKQWSEAREELADIPTTVLPAALRFLFLARCDEELGNSRGAEEQWGLVRRELRSADPSSLRFIAAQAEARGRRQIAAAAYRAMSHTDVLAKDGLLGLLRTLPLDTPADEVVSIHTDLLTLAPGNTDVLAGQAYFQLLARIDVPLASETAARLINEQPQSLPLRAIAALAALRNEKPTEAAAILEGLPDEEWQKAADRWKVIRVAASEAIGGNASELRGTIRPQNLRSEEAMLLTAPTR